MIAIEYKEKAFEFKSEESITDKIKIENEAAKLSGGKLQLAELKTAVEEALDLLLDYNRNQYGAEGSQQKRQRLQELRLAQDFNEEYTKIFNELNDNSSFNTFFRLSQERDNIYAYARLTVLCTKKPDGYNFYEQKEEDLQAIIKKLEDEQVFFRR
mgnify:CR=1 FL=1